MLNESWKHEVFRRKIGGPIFNSLCACSLNWGSSFSVSVGVHFSHKKKVTSGHKLNTSEQRRVLHDAMNCMIPMSQHLTPPWYLGTIKHLLETHVYRLGLIDQLDSNHPIHTKLCTNKMYTESVLSLLLQEICFLKNCILC